MTRACLLLAILVLTSTWGCDDDPCASNERRICKGSDDCQCGPACYDDGDCASWEDCAKFSVDGAGDPGVCVDSSWSGGTNDGGGGGGGGDCAPACASYQYCVNVDGVPTCLNGCSSDSECAHCCRATDTGLRICAPSSSYCGGGGGGGGECHDRNQCVQVVEAVAGDNCGEPTSLNVRLRNACPESIAVQICIRDAGGKCDCGMDGDLGPGEEMFTYSCRTENRYTFQAGTTDDYMSGNGCFPDDC